MSLPIARATVLLLALLTATAFAEDGEEPSSSNAKITVPKEWNLRFYDGGPRSRDQEYSFWLKQDGSIEVTGRTRWGKDKDLMNGKLTEEKAESIYRAAVALLRRNDFNQGGFVDTPRFSLVVNGNLGAFALDNDGLVDLADLGPALRDFLITLHGALPKDASPRWYFPMAYFIPRLEPSKKVGPNKWSIEFSAAARNQQELISTYVYSLNYDGKVEVKDSRFFGWSLRRTYVGKIDEQDALAIYLAARKAMEAADPGIDGSEGPIDMTLMLRTRRYRPQILHSLRAP